MNFFIVGTSRSGSTLLHNLVSHQAGVAAFNETHWLPKLYELFGLTPAPIETLLEHASKITWDTGENLIAKNLQFASKPPELFYKGFSAAAENHPFVTVAEFHQIINQLIYGNKALWRGDKTPDYGYYMGMLQKLWPEGKFIHIYRNGIDTALSMSHHPGCRLQLSANVDNWIPLAYDKQYQQYEHCDKALGKYIASWRRRMVRIRDEATRLKPDTYLEVNYDQLIQNPEGVLSEVFGFLSIPLPNDVIHYAQSVINIKSKKNVDINGLCKNLEIADIATLYQSGAMDIYDVEGGTEHSEKTYALFRQLGECASFSGQVETADVLVELIAEFIQQKEIDIAKHWLKKALKLFPFDVALNKARYALLANESSVKQEADKFMPLLEEFSRTPNHFPAINKLANAYLSFNEPGKAGKLFNHAKNVVKNTVPVRLGLGRVQDELGDHTAAQLYYRQVLREVPDNANAARLLARSMVLDGKPEQAVEFLINVREKYGYNDFPHNLLCSTLLSLGEHSKALSWAIRGVEEDPERPENVVALNNVYLRMGDLDAAFESSGKALKKWSDNQPLLTNAAFIYARLSHWKCAADCWRRLDKIYGLNKNQQVQYALSLLNSGQFVALESFVRLMEDQANAIKIQAQVFERQKQAHEAAKKWKVYTLEDTGNSIGLCNLIKLSVELGELTKAEEYIHKGKRLFQDNEGISLYELKLNAITKGYSQTYELALHYEKQFPNSFQIRSFILEALFEMGLLDSAVDYAIQLRNQFPESVWPVSRLAELYINMGEEKKAAEIIAGISKHSLSPQHTNLRSWLLMRDNKVDEAKQLWSKCQEQNYFSALHSDAQDLQRQFVASTPLDQDDIALFTVLRNEIGLLPAFIKYYRALGVRQFFVVDNGSDDGSYEWLGEQEDVCLYQMSSSYKEADFGIRWINELMGVHGGNRWCLYVDIDEFLVFPYLENASLKALTCYLDTKGFDAVSGFMLDMYPEQKLSGRQSIDALEDVLDLAPFFDNSYRFLNSSQSPFRKVFGGFRRRFFWGNESNGNPLVKTPLIKGGRGVSLLSSSHFISPAYVADVSVALLHFKFLGDDENRFAEEIKRKEHACIANEYERYHKVLGATGPGVSLWCESSTRYQNSEQLLNLRLISSGDWRY